MKLHPPAGGWMLISCWAAAQMHKARRIPKTRSGVCNSFIDINRLDEKATPVGWRAPRVALMVTREPIVYYAYAAVLFTGGQARGMAGGPEPPEEPKI